MFLKIMENMTNKANNNSKSKYHASTPKRWDFKVQLIIVTHEIAFQTGKVIEL